jgi:hypothetical protein
MEDKEQSNTKIPAGTNIEPSVYAIVQALRVEEDRSMSSMIERLLKTHPRVAERLETAEVAAR